MRVEVYSGVGVFLNSTTTDASGNYSFTIGSSGAFTIRVVSATADLGVGAVPEQTYEHNGVTGNGGSGALGGNNPVTDDTATAQGAGVGDTNVSITAAGLNITGVDFGLAYNLIVNTNNAGQGSLRQFLLNANAIPGANSSQFNIPTTDPNFNTVIANGFTIQPASALPVLTDNSTSLDGATQEANRGDQRAGLPDIVIDGLLAGTDAYGLHIQSSNNTIRSLDIRRFNNGQPAGAGTGVVVDGSTGGGDSNTIRDNYLTLNSNTSSVVGAIAITGAADNNTFNANTLTGNFSDGLRFSDGASTGNAFTSNQVVSNADDGVKLVGSNITFSGNTVSNNGAVNPASCGVEVAGVTGGTIANNTISNNGSEGGVCIVATANTGNTVGPNNTISGNAGPGIRTETGVAGILTNRFTQNQISGNGDVGIDLNDDGVTANDAGDGDAGPNDYLNFPVIYSVSLSSGNVTLTGEARPGATLEFFEAAADPTGYGEGQTFIGSAAEGSGSDSNSAAGTVDATANQFTFTFSAGSLASGDDVTATATDASGNTSEFSLNAGALDRVTSGLQALYTFEEGGGSVVNDVSGVGSPLNLTIGNPANTSWTAGYLTVNASTIIQSGASATKVNNACVSANEITVEAWIRPSSTAQGGGGIVPRIVSISTDTSNRNIALVHGDQTLTALYSGRLRTTSTDNNGAPNINTPDGSLTTSLTHVVYTRDSAGNANLYINDAVSATGTIGGNLSNWNTAYLLALANEFSMDRPWLGEYHLVAIYCRALSAGEVNQNYTAGP